MISILTQFKTYGVTNGYFDIRRIGDFEKSVEESFDHINTNAIDFDKTKDKVCRDLGQECYKSCDALDIIESKNRINFIEFKNLIDTTDIENWIGNLDLPRKIRDSRDILLHILRDIRFCYSRKRQIYTNIEKNVIISVDLVDSATRNFVILQRLNIVREIIKSQFIDNYVQGEKYNDPICIKKQDFDAEYTKYS